jgi:hypothetical protein
MERLPLKQANIRGDGLTKHFRNRRKAIPADFRSERVWNREKAEGHS